MTLTRYERQLLALIAMIYRRSDDDTIRAIIAPFLLNAGVDENGQPIKRKRAA